MINFPKFRLRMIYSYLRFHDDETILMKDIQEATAMSDKTVKKYIQWLISHEVIEKDGKHFKILKY